MSDPPSGKGRVSRLPQAEAQQAAQKAGIPPGMAILSVFQVLLKSPNTAKALNELLNVLLWKSALDPKLRELVIMRLGWKTGSVYEWTQHWRFAKGIGMSDEKILAARDWEKNAALTPAERAVFAATDDTLANGGISDAVWKQCEEHIPGGEAALIDLVVSIGNWRMFSSLLRSLKVPLEDGISPWPPDGKRPEGGD